MEAWGTLSAWIQDTPEWLAGAGAALALSILVVALWRASLRLGVSLAGDPEAGGSLEAWAKLGPWRADWQKRTGEPARQSLRFFGLRVRSRQGASQRPRKKAERDSPKPAKKGGAWQSFRFLLRHWDLRELGAFAWKRRRDFRIRGLAGRAEFGFSEPEHTGEIYGALCVLTAVLPPLRADADGSVRTDEFALFPDWSLQDRLAGRVEAGMEIRVVRALVATLFFFATHWHRARRHWLSHA